MLDISGTTEPKSDQQNYDDYIAGPKTVTVSEVKKGNPDQPVELHLVEFPGRPYKPGKSMRRVLIACWGTDASAYVGRQLVLYGDPSVKFGGQEVGGIRIAALSHINEPVTVNLTVTRGKRAPFVVQPLTVDVNTHLAALKKASTLAELKSAFDAAVAAGVGGHPDVRALKDTRKAELSKAES